MRVLVACESSGRVRDAFLAEGHDAMSCDLLPTEVEGPHYRGDVRDVIDDGWDLMIAHPPCNYLARSGMHWTTRGLRDPRLTEDALDFVQLLMDAPIPMIAIENPVGIISKRIRLPDQVVNPYEFGEDASKKTCLWLKGLPLLLPTKIVEPRLVCCDTVIQNGDKYGCAVCNGSNAGKPRWGNQADDGQCKLGSSKSRHKNRSRTFQGLADAMVEQWGKLMPFKPSTAVATRGKPEEKEVQTFLENYNKHNLHFDFLRLPDARAAGGRMKAMPADYEYFMHHAHGLIEVKAVDHKFRIAKDKVTQLPAMNKRSLAGGRCFLLVHHTPQDSWRIVESKYLEMGAPSWDLSGHLEFDSAASALYSIGVFTDD